ncbi:putative allantoate permease [Phaeomoniella chlamydospora]|uniref:Putative allantoate permease n=1 Tax=Phaeomoniella chlamydospora TaxID=158046 RepID=A0A0G2EIA9_PHACM|nr:putative allantoate permease [Phaeomoniella chlamydospora]
MAEKQDSTKTDPMVAVDDKDEIGRAEYNPRRSFSIKPGEVEEDLDEAEIFLRANNVSHGYLQELLQDEEKNKKIVRKVDFMLMPLLCGTYFLQYIDKQALSYGAVFDLLSDTGMWYTRKEQPARAGLFYCFNGFGSMMGGILFYAVGQEDNFPVWKVIFLLCGSVTIVWGVVMMFFLPNDITSAKRYTLEEKTLLIARSQTNRTGVYNRKIKMSQVFEAFRDPQVWILFFFTLLNECINGGVANFGKLIIKGLTGGDSLLTTAGPFIASKFKNIRTYIMALYICPTIIGATLLWQLPRTNKNGLLLAYYIIGSYVASLVLALQLPANNVGGYTKRVTSTAFVFLAYCAGNIIGPHAFLDSEAPVYQTGCKLILGCAAGQVVLVLALRYLLISRNKRRDAEAIANGQTQADIDAADEVLEDLTDFQNPKFRYSY